MESKRLRELFGVIAFFLLIEPVWNRNLGFAYEVPRRI